MKAYYVRSNPYPGSDYSELHPQARKLFNMIKGQTKRQPYVRSAYFDKNKVFIELFWVHLNQKNRKERNKRIKYYACGIELLRATRLEPVSKSNPNKHNEKLHRFAGITPQGDLFYIQVKENLRTKRKDLMSIFPAE